MSVETPQAAWSLRSGDPQTRLLLSLSTHWGDATVQRLHAVYRTETSCLSRSWGEMLDADVCISLPPSTRTLPPPCCNLYTSAIYCWGQLESYNSDYNIVVYEAQWCVYMHFFLVWVSFIFDSDSSALIHTSPLTCTDLLSVGDMRSACSTI